MHPGGRLLKVNDLRPDDSSSRFVDQFVYFAMRNAKYDSIILPNSQVVPLKPVHEQNNFEFGEKKETTLYADEQALFTAVE